MKRTRSGPPERLPLGATLAEVSGVVVRRGSATLLDGVGLEVAAGEVVALVGPNGAGKSTLVGVISGDVTVDSGRVEVHGAALASWDAISLARRRSVLPQRVDVAFPFAVADVVRMGRSPWPASLDDDRRVAEALDRVDARHLAARTFPSLSGGERARVALARVLAQAAQLVLLDEPTAALDLGHQELVLGRARIAAEAGDGLVVVLHDLNLAAAYADRIVVLRSGTVVAHGAPRDVLTAELVTEVYGHPVEVLHLDGRSAPLVVPRRGGVAMTPAAVEVSS